MTSSNPSPSSGTPGVNLQPPANIMLGIESISPFSGTSGAEDFLESIEQTAILGNWTEQQKIAVARLKLRGLAKQYVDAEPGLKLTADWTLLKENLITRYRKRVIPGQALREFLECRQRQGENCRDYLIRLKLAANRTVKYTGDVVHDNVLRQKLEEDTTKQFIMGLSTPVRRRVLSAEPVSLDAAVTIAEREEVIESISNPPRQWHPVYGISNPEPRINPPNNVSHQVNKQANQPRRNQPDISRRPLFRYEPHNENRTYLSRPDSRRTLEPSNIQCFNCNQRGHFARHCTANQRSDNRRCYGCNQSGHFIRHCPHKTMLQPLNQEAAPCTPRRAAAESQAQQQ